MSAKQTFLRVVYHKSGFFPSGYCLLLHAFVKIRILALRKGRDSFLKSILKNALVEYEH